MTDKQDYFTLNGIDLDKAYEMTIGARGMGKLFFFEQLCIKLREENRILRAEIKDLQDLMVKYNGDFAKQEAEIEFLKGVNTDLEARQQDKIKQAYKVLAAEIISDLHNDPHIDLTFYVYIKFIIKDIVRRLTNKK